MATQTVKDTMKITEHDAMTHIAVDREMNETEVAEFENRQTKVLAEKAEAQATATARAGILERLGLTEQEAKILLS